MTAEELKTIMALPEAEIRRRGWFMAESPNVIERALQAGLEPVAAWCEEKIPEEFLDRIRFGNPDVCIFRGGERELTSIKGYALIRGILCLMRRPAMLAAHKITAEAKRLCVIYDVCDAVNVGIIFRTAAALGYDGVLLSPGTCDPLNRRSIRTSMGTVFQIPWGYAEDVFPLLRGEGFTAVATALRPDSLSLEDFEVSRSGRYAVVFGSEGYGLPKEAIDACDNTVIIPMKAGVDSLNVGAAAAITLWHFRP